MHRIKYELGRLAEAARNLAPLWALVLVASIVAALAWIIMAARGWSDFNAMLTVAALVVVLAGVIAAVYYSLKKGPRPATPAELGFGEDDFFDGPLGR